MRRFLILILVLTCSCKMQGQVWTNLIDSLQNSPFQLHCAVVDSNANVLYLGGYFYRVNQFPFMTARGVIRYNGNSIDTLQLGIDYQDSTSGAIVYSMQMFQNKLYVFGQFNKTGKYHCKHIGRWNGNSWDTVNFMPLGPTRYTDVYNNELYVAGGVATATGSIVKYDGVNWHDLQYPIQSACITALKNYDGKLYVSGLITPQSSCANLSYYDGSTWHPWVGVSGDNNKSVFGMNVIDSMLYVYGRFNSIAGTNCRGLAAYNSKTNRWYGFGSGLSNSSWETISNVQKVNGEIYVTGNFYTIEDISTVAGWPVYMKTEIVKLVGNKWCALSEPFDNVVAGVVGYNNNLFAYGPFRQIGNDTVLGFVRWDGGNYTKACSSTFDINSSYVGIGKTFIFDNLKIYPNPVKDKLRIEYPSFEFSSLKFEIVNSFGQILIRSEKLENNQEVDLGDLSPGIYLLKLSNSKTQKTFKIIKE